MIFEEFKSEFDDAFAAVADEELVEAFAKMGCEVVITSRPGRA